MLYNYCLSAVCPGPGHLFTIACKRLVSYLHVKSLRFEICSHDDLNWTPYRCRPHERPQQTYKLRPYYLRVRVRCLVATRCRAGQPHLRVYTPCLSAKVSGRDKTLYCHLWPVWLPWVFFSTLSHKRNDLKYIYIYIYIYIYTGCFTTLGHNCRRWFPRSLWSKKFI